MDLLHRHGVCFGGRPLDVVLKTKVWVTSARKSGLGHRDINCKGKDIKSGNGCSSKSSSSIKQQKLKTAEVSAAATATTRDSTDGSNVVSSSNSNDSRREQQYQ